MPETIAGILSHVRDMTVFLNPCENSYRRLGSDKAPSYLSWSNENRSQLIRIPSAAGEYKRAELRSPDPLANPYIAFALIIYAGLDGIKRKRKLPQPTNINLYTADKNILEKYKRLPLSLKEAAKTASDSNFIRKYLPSLVVSAYCDMIKQ